MRIDGYTAEKQKDTYVLTRCFDTLLQKANRILLRSNAAFTPSKRRVYSEQKSTMAWDKRKVPGLRKPRHLVFIPSLLA